MSHQSTLDAHLSPVTPRKRPRRPSPVPSGSSSDGERGLSTIKLAAAPTHPRPEDLTMSERRRMKQRVLDLEDDVSDQNDNERRERRKERAPRRHGEDPDAGQISMRLVDEESESDDPPEVETAERSDREVTPSLGLRNRYASKSKSPVASSQVYYIPSDSEEPIVLSSQAHSSMQATMEHALQELEAAGEALLNGTQEQAGALDPVLALADAQDTPMAARRIVDASRHVSIDRKSPVAFIRRKLAQQRIESVEIMTPRDFDKSLYTPTSKQPAIRTQRATRSTSKTATPTPAPPPKPKSTTNRSQALPAVRETTRPSDLDLEDDDLEWAVAAAESRVPAAASREDTEYSDGGLGDADLLASVDPAMEEAAEHAEIESEPEEPVKQTKRASTKAKGKSKATVTSDEELPPGPRASTQAGPSRLPATAKAKVAALAERKRVQRTLKEKTTRIRDDFIADDDETSEDEAPQPRKKTKPVKQKAPKRKGKQRQEVSDEEAIRRRNLKSLRRQSRKIRDPDDDVNDPAVSEAEDMVREVELDEADRFKSATRLRKRKETAFQRALRKRNNLRNGIHESTTESETESSGDNAPIEVSDDSWIEDVGDEFDDSLMPQQFSNSSTQTPEFVFKVVFQYMLLLVIAGPECLPLNRANEEYFIPRLKYMRRKLSGIQTSVVQSQIWRPDFVKAMQTFPHLHSNYMDELYDGCDACHMSGRMSRFEVIMDGRRYDNVTFEELSDDDDSRGSDGESLASEDDLPREFKLGRMCHARTRVFHQFCHWEYNLHKQIKFVYDDIKLAKGRDVSESETEENSELSEEERHEKRRVRAEDKRRRQQRVNQMKAKRLPSDIGDLNEVLQWFEDKGHVGRLFVAHEQLIDSAHKLENMKGSRDDE